MAQYTVQAPDGKMITLEGPDGASHEDVIAQAQKLYQAGASPGRGGTPQIKAAQATSAQNEAARKKAERIAKYGPDPSDKYEGMTGAALDALAGVGAGIAQTGLGAYDILRKATASSTGQPMLPEVSPRIRNLGHAPETVAGKLGEMGEAAAEFALAGPEKAAATLAKRMGRAAVTGGAQAALKSGGDPVSTAVGAAGGAVGDGIATGVNKLIAKAANAPATKLSEDVAADLAAKAKVAAEEAKAVGEMVQSQIGTATQQASELAGAIKALPAKTSIRAEKSAEAAKAAFDASRAANKGAARSVANEATKAANDAATVASTRLADATGTTQFDGLAQLAEAAKGGDGRAGNLLKDIEAANGNPGKIQRASIALKNWITGKESSRLYGEVEKAIDKAGIAVTDVPLDTTEGVLANAIKDAETGKLPANERVVSLLKKIQDNIGAGDSDALMDNSYRAIRKLDDDIGNAIRDGSKGKDALIGDAEVRYLQQIRSAVRQDMDRFVSHSGAPEVVEAAKKADAYYRQTRVPFKELDIAGSGTATDADQIFDKFIKAGKGDAAQRFYNALDEKGRASVREQMVQDALNHATDPVRGTLDPEKYFDFHNKLLDAYGVFFKGGDKFEMDGVQKLMKEAALARDVKGAPSIASMEELAAAKARGRSLVADAKANAAGAASQVDTELAAEVARLKAEAKAAMDAAKGPQERAAAAAEFAKAEAKARSTQNKTLLGVVGTDIIGGSLLHGNPVITGTIGIAAAIKAAMNTPQGRKFIMAASTLEPGSKPMAEMLQKVVKAGQEYTTGAINSQASRKP